MAASIRGTSWEGGEGMLAWHDLLDLCQGVFLCTFCPSRGRFPGAGAAASRRVMSKPRTSAPLLYHFCRLRWPGVELPLQAFARHLERAFKLYLARAQEGQEQAWSRFVENLHPLDWFLACACLEGIQPGWEALFSARAS